MDFERYRVPKSVTEGVRIELPGTEGAEFVVALPSEHNRAFQAAQQRALKLKIGPDEEPDFSGVDVLAWQQARLDAFLEYCLLRLPDGITREQLAGEYYPGLVALFARACDLAADETKAALAAAKKSKA